MASVRRVHVVEGAAMKKPEINLKVALGLGKGRDRVPTCDLTKDISPRTMSR
jgi:N-acetylglutamate synthase/N-acetylornithine aminotransferase